MEAALQVAERGERECRVLRFAGFQLDLGTERLWRDGNEVRVRRKPYSILRYLVRHPHRLVAHSEIIEVVWGERIAMSDGLLRTHIHDLRQVIGHRFIETVAGRGYRFVPRVEESDGRPSRPPDDDAHAELVIENTSPQ
jgi:DNA-binding winged helix-turn-helix (wHTH) protein